MRSWYLTTLALESRLDPYPHDHYGVYDRRPIAMFLARVVSACFAMAAFIYGLSLAVPANPHSQFTPHSPYPQSHSQQPPTPVVAKLSKLHISGTFVRASDGTELVFQKPPHESLGAVLFLHGCSHSATDFFPSDSKCSTCIGLPEELKMTRIALEAGFTVVAVSSTDRVRKCWNADPRAAGGPDYERVHTALEELQRRNIHSRRLPLFAVGISSGGFFATSLPMRFQVAGVNSIVAGAVSSTWKKGNSPMASYPPHFFTHMGLKDKQTARRVKQARDIFQSIGTPSMEMIVPPKSVTTSFLQDSIPTWDSSTTRELVAALQRGGYLDAQFRLLTDPRRSQWRKSVQHLESKLGDHLRPDKSALSEELNRAWGSHEITADHFDEALGFLTEHARP